MLIVWPSSIVKNRFAAARDNTVPIRFVQWQAWQAAGFDW